MRGCTLCWALLASSQVSPLRRSRFCFQTIVRIHLRKSRPFCSSDLGSFPSVFNLVEKASMMIAIDWLFLPFQLCTSAKTSGMCCAGQTRMTVSLCVIMLEMCKAEATLPFLMVVIIIAKGAADRFGDSSILRRIKLKNLPFLERMPHLTLRRGRHSAREIVKKMDFPMLPKCASFSSTP